MLSCKWCRQTIAADEQTWLDTYTNKHLCSVCGPAMAGTSADFTGRYTMIRDGRIILEGE